MFADTKEASTLAAANQLNSLFIVVVWTLMRVNDSMSLKTLNHFVMSCAILDSIGYHCYLCHSNAIFRVGKKPCSCNIIVPLIFVDIHARTLLERIQPENSCGSILKMYIFNFLWALIKLNSYSVHCLSAPPTFAVALFTNYKHLTSLT